MAIVPIHFVALNTEPEPIKSAGETPNAVTIQTMKDVLAGKNVVRCENAEDMFANWESKLRAEAGLDAQSDLRETIRA